ncbi:hypothetical protein [Nostoc phage Nsp-JY18]
MDVMEFCDRLFDALMHAERAGVPKTCAICVGYETEMSLAKNSQLHSGALAFNPVRGKADDPRVTFCGIPVRAVEGIPEGTFMLAYLPVS